MLVSAADDLDGVKAKRARPATTGRSGPRAPPRTRAVGGNGHASRFFTTTLARYQGLVTDEIRRQISRRRFRKEFARRLQDYPLRAGKGLRPALCLATCQALGGRQADALNSAVALELFHNAFLVHDDIEDESLSRRGKPTAHMIYGSAIAINVGDALSVLALKPLLDNLEIVGLAKTLQIFEEIERMARESVEGQAMELEWVREHYWQISERNYFLMSKKKTCWYTCISPCRIGALIAGNGDVDLDAFNRFGFYLGIAFQMQDDTLNLIGDESRYRKETAGDIWEGKRTIMLIHLLRHCLARERRSVVATLSRPRAEKSTEEVDEILGLMHRYGSIEYTMAISRKFAAKAQDIFNAIMGDLPPTPHKRFLKEMIDFVVHRDL